MTITSFSSLEELNTHCYNRFIEDESMLQFNHYTAHIISEDLITNFRNYLLNSRTLAEFISDYCEQNSTDSSVIISTPNTVTTYDLYTAGFSGSVYFVPFSKKDLISAYFAHLTPQLAESVFDLMKSTGRLIQIGGGGGKAFILKPIEFTQSHYDSLPVFHTPEQSITILQGALDSLKVHLKNDDYYHTIIAQKEEEIARLNEHILELNKRITQVYQTTWR